jgi:hypothetical protein
VEGFRYVIELPGCSNEYLQTQMSVTKQFNKQYKYKHKSKQKRNSSKTHYGDHRVRVGKCKQPKSPEIVKLKLSTQNVCRQRIQKCQNKQKRPGTEYHQPLMKY